ncbi:unnamed protein product, partial [marine sediment metagenome]
MVPKYGKIGVCPDQIPNRPEEVLKPTDSGGLYQVTSINNQYGIWLILGHPVGDKLVAIGEDFVAISWNTLRAVEVDLHYSTAAVYDATEVWEETLAFEPHKGVAEIRLGNLKPGTTYRYRIVIYDGDAVYPSPIGHFTTSSRETRSFCFLVYGDTRTFPDRHKLVADRMAEDEPNAV